MASRVWMDSKREAPALPDRLVLKMTLSRVTDTTRCTHCDFLTPEGWAWALNSVSVTRGRRTTEPSIGPSVTTLGWHGAEMQFVTYMLHIRSTQNNKNTQKTHLDTLVECFVDRIDCGKRCSTGFGGLGSTLRPGLETETETTRLKPSCAFPMYHKSPHIPALSFPPVIHFMCHNMPEYMIWFGGNLHRVSGSFHCQWKKHSISWFHRWLFGSILSKNGKHYCKLQKCMDKGPCHTG